MTDNEEKILNCVDVFCYTVSEKEYRDAQKANDFKSVLNKGKCVYESHSYHEGDTEESATTRATDMLFLLKSAYGGTKEHLKGVEDGFHGYTERIEFRLSDKDADDLAGLVEFENMSRSELIRSWIREKHSEFEEDEDEDEANRDE